jgi:hypothetical protein
MAVSQRGLIAGGAGIGVLMVAATYLGGIAPARSHTASVKSQVTAAQEANLLLTIKNNGLKKQAAGLSTLTAELAADQVALPGANGVPGFIREVNALAAANGVSISSIAPAAPTVANNTAATGSTATSTTPVGTVYSIPVAIVVAGSQPAELAFLKALQTTEPRAVLVGTVSIAAGAKGNATMSIASQIFLAPKSAAEQALLNKELAGSS